ncbi:hypothetical protein BUALT_Bualt03G0086000 [Buddleja alternifolia]|uniref:F-box protein n=1 Tax=Buddleja alternifolia TaxID=168488 RepID=A0AAV6Y3D5_9LAMI|nr:hypothetical protein BUALT_Bualt03G0086000 [Buddleja alternifolia]
MSHGLANSCNGLVLVVSDEALLWNPSTKRYKKLSPTPHEFEGEVHINEHYNFGFDSKSDDYKVVTVTKDFPHILPSGKKIWGVYLNDALHIVVRHYYHNESIMAVDLGTTDHYEVPKPDLRGENMGVSYVEVMGGCLTVVVPLNMNRSETWKEGIWGDEVYLNYDGRCILSYNLWKKCSRIVSIRGPVPQFYDVYSSGSTFWVEVCVGSLVLLDSRDQADVTEKRNVQGETD